MQVTVNYLRPGKGVSVYVEELVADDGRRLTTYKELAGEAGQALTAALVRLGWIDPADTVAAVRKHYFYDEHFDVLEFYKQGGQVAGYYSDITTPLERVNGEYYVTDLFLDFWLAPGQPALELDEDEFEAAVAGGLLTAEQQAHALRAFERLRADIAAGVYPWQYIR